MAKSAKLPRISVNKLAEYLESSPTRRKKIIYDAKYPSKFIVTRYTDARDIMKTYLRNGQEEDFVLKAIEDLEKKKPKTDFQEQDIALSIESLELLLETDTSVLEGYEVSCFEGVNELVKIVGVDVSVNPDLILTKKVGDIVNVGSVKLHLSKSNLLSNESQKVVAVMLQSFTSSYVVKKGEVANYKQSKSVDVFQRTIECCPTAFKLRMKNVEAACEEIALWWDTL